MAYKNHDALVHETLKIECFPNEISQTRHIYIYIYIYVCKLIHPTIKLTCLPITTLSVDVLEEQYSASCSTTPTSFHNK